MRLPIQLKMPGATILMPAIIIVPTMIFCFQLIAGFFFFFLIGAAGVAWDEFDMMNLIVEIVSYLTAGRDWWLVGAANFGKLLAKQTVGASLDCCEAKKTNFADQKPACSSHLLSLFPLYFLLFP